MRPSPTRRVVTESAETDRSAAPSVPCGNRTVVIGLPAGPDDLDHLIRCLDHALNSDPRTVVLDLSGVRHLSSTTVAALLWARRRCAPRGVDLRLRRPPRRSHHLIERMDLAGVVSVEPMLGGRLRSRMQIAMPW